MIELVEGGGGGIKVLDESIGVFDGVNDGSVLSEDEDGTTEGTDSEDEGGGGGGGTEELVTGGGGGAVDRGGLMLDLVFVFVWDSGGMGVLLGVGQPCGHEVITMVEVVKVVWTAVPDVYVTG